MSWASLSPTNRRHPGVPSSAQAAEVSLRDCVLGWRVLRLRTVAREVECQVVLNHTTPSQQSGPGLGSSPLPILIGSTVPPDTPWPPWHCSASARPVGSLCPIAVLTRHFLVPLTLWACGPALSLGCLDGVSSHHKQGVRTKSWDFFYHTCVWDIESS